jgi:hypothetical protein
MTVKRNTHRTLLVKYGGEGGPYEDTLLRDVYERSGSGLYTTVGFTTSGVELSDSADTVGQSTVRMERSQRIMKGGNTAYGVRYDI